MNRSIRTAALLAGVFALTPALPVVAPAPHAPAGVVGALGAQVPGDGPGVVRTGLLLRQLRGEKRVLAIAAHPDDEDTALLTALARRDGAEIAYLSLTRGEGGQNLIGSELYEGLGLVRTGELMAARELDGARQFFTRAIDFGFSKNAAEALTQWPREEILADVVEVIRGFRPHVVIALFSGTPADGHGQHQAAGILAREAFEAAGDPDRFPEHFARGLSPWSPSALYGRAGRGGRGGRGGGGGGGGAPGPGQAALDSLLVRVETGGLDPLLGQSHRQLAAESRSQHRSQDMGQGGPLGPSGATLRFEAGDIEVDGSGLFAGIDTTLIGNAPTEVSTEALGAALSLFGAMVGAAAQELNAADPTGSVVPLGWAVESLRRAGYDALRVPHGLESSGTFLDRKLALAQEALLSAAAIVVDARIDDRYLVPGGSAVATVTVWNGGPFSLDLPRSPELDVPPGWTAAPEEAEPGPLDVPPGSVTRFRYEVTVPADAPVSRPYFLADAPDGAVYRWPEDQGVRGLARAPALVHAQFDLRLHTGTGIIPVEVRGRREVRYFEVDPAVGEWTEPVLVVPQVSLEVTPGSMVWPVAQAGGREVAVTVRNWSPDVVDAQIRLDVPQGWDVSPVSIPVQLGGGGGGRTLSFNVAPGTDLAPGAARMTARATTVDGRSFEEGFRLVDYGHIDRSALYRDAAVEVARVDVTLDPDLRIGYVMGSGDSGDEALRQMGAQVEVLGPDRVAAGDFSGFDVLVLGVRAYETRDDLIAANDAVLDFARSGGTVVTQYNQYGYPPGGYAPYPVQISRPHGRVTDETAPVRLLDPEAPVFTGPNRIGPTDFDGWVQERGLYFLSEWDDAFRPLIEMNDPGESPLRGSLLVAPVGEGVYVYTGLAFFRQFPRGVPGAFRLFANLVSLDAEEWTAYLRGEPGGTGPEADGAGTAASKGTGDERD